MRNKEDIIRDQRTREAVKKGLMGQGGKLGCIARYLGQEIVRQGGSYYTQNFIDLTGIQEDENMIPYMEEDETAITEGYMFDGLSRGLHMEIRLSEERSEIYVRWQGDIVYREMAGELYGYCPGEWEESVDRLFVQAKEKEGREHRAYEERALQAGQRRKEHFLEEMKRKWGLK